MKNSKTGITIRVVDPDDDYLGIEIQAWNAEFAGSTFIYAGLDELGEFALRIDGFPSRVPDERMYEFGARDQRFAGGYCRLCFYTTDGSGHTVIEIEIENEDRKSSARFSIPVVAAAIDRFVLHLRAMDKTKRGEARLSQVD